MSQLELIVCFHEEARCCFLNGIEGEQTKIDGGHHSRGAQLRSPNFETPCLVVPALISLISLISLDTVMHIIRSSKMMDESQVGFSMEHGVTYYFDRICPHLNGLVWKKNHVDPAVRVTVCAAVAHDEC
jgi:hypothetical protein